MYLFTKMSLFSINFTSSFQKKSVSAKTILAYAAMEDLLGPNAPTVIICKLLEIAYATSPNNLFLLYHCDFGEIKMADKTVKQNAFFSRDAFVKEGVKSTQ